MWPADGSSTDLSTGRPEVWAWWNSVYQYGSKQYLGQDRSRDYLQSTLQEAGSVHLTVPLLDGRADCCGDLLPKQPRLPTLCHLSRVASEERLQGSCLVPAHQQLWLWVQKEPSDISWDTGSLNRHRLRLIKIYYYQSNRVNSNSKTRTRAIKLYKDS